MADVPVPRSQGGPAAPGGGVRPGYGRPHPALAALLTSLAPAAAERVTWPGQIRVDVAAHPTPTRLPDELVTSVRCIVRVGERIVVCQAPDTTHIWPGGRREPGETYPQTACREVYEETGWLIDEAALRPLGFLHYRMVDAQPDDHPYPHPDFLQLVYTARALRHADPANTAWTDLDGWERGHRLLTPAELAGVEVPAVQRVFLDVLGATGTG